MGAIDNLAASFNASKPIGQRRPFDEFGRYYQKIQSVRVAKSFQKGGEYCAIEKRVVRCIETPPDGLRQNHVGQEIVDMINNFGNQAKVFGSKCRMFVSTVLGASFEETTFADFELCCGDKQPLAGMLVEIDNSPRMVKVTQGPKAGQMENRPNKTYVRGFTAAETAQILTKEEIEKFYPNGELDRLIAAEAGTAAPAAK